MTLRRILASAALFAATVTTAVAGPVTIASVNIDDSVLGANNSFSISSPFVIGTGGKFTLTLKAGTTLEDNLLIDSLSLVGDTGAYYFGGTSGNALPTAQVSHVSEEIFGFPIDTWTSSFVFSDLFLTAGDWILQVGGSQTDSKVVGTLDAVIEANAVPEPQSLALAAGALAALALVRRRQRAVR